MGFLGVYRAIYDYAPQAENELAVSDGDLLFIKEKGEDDWWTAKKKAADEEEEEPEGLVPRNYIEEVSDRTKATTRTSASCYLKIRSSASNGHIGAVACVSVVSCVA